MVDLTELVNYIYAAIAAAGVGAFAVAARHYLSDKAAEHVEALIEELAAMLLSRYQAQGVEVNVPDAVESVAQRVIDDAPKWLKRAGGDDMWLQDMAEAAVRRLLG